MNAIRQLWSVSLLNLRNLPARFDAALVALIGLAGGALGGLVAYLAFNGFQASTLNQFSQIVSSSRSRQS
jgi:hypothetical protein